MKTFYRGFWIICIALVLSFSLPCYAQVETEGFFLPDNTAWKINNGSGMMLSDPHLGFWGGSLFFCGGGMPTCYAYDESQYKNRLISKFDGHYCSDYIIFGETVCYSVYGYVIPFLGIGHMTYYVTTDWPPIGGDRFVSILTRDDFH